MQPPELQQWPQTCPNHRLVQWFVRAVEDACQFYKRTLESYKCDMGDECIRAVEHRFSGPQKEEETGKPSSAKPVDGKESL